MGPAQGGPTGAKCVSVVTNHLSEGPGRDPKKVPIWTLLGARARSPKSIKTCCLTPPQKRHRKVVPESITKRRAFGGCRRDPPGDQCFRQLTKSSSRGGSKRYHFLPRRGFSPSGKKVAKNVGVLLKNKPFWNSSADPADPPDPADPGKTM